MFESPKRAHSTFLIGLLQITHKVNLSAHTAPVLAMLYLCSGHSAKLQAHRGNCPSLSSLGDSQGTSKTPCQNPSGYSCTSPPPKQELIKTPPGPLSKPCLSEFPTNHPTIRLHHMKLLFLQIINVRILAIS